MIAASRQIAMQGFCFIQCICIMAEFGTKSVGMICGMLSIHAQSLLTIAVPLSCNLTQ